MPIRLDVLALIAIALSPVRSLAQQPVFRADTTLLELEVRVTDERNRVVESLSESDFTVFENGEPRAIVGFEYVDATAAKGLTIVPARVSRLLILLDAPPEELGRAIPAVRRFLRERVPEGLLVSLNGLAFTDDKQTLLDQLERRAWSQDALATGGTTAIDPALREAGIGQVKDYKANLVEDELGRARLHRYLAVVGALARYPGRKSIALFSRGYPLGFDPASGTFANMQGADLLEALRGEATRGRVRLYAVNIRGLAAMNATSDASASTLALEVEGASDAGRGVSLGASDALQLLQNGLSVLATQTGGEAVLNDNRLDQIFDPVLRDEGDYYLITYAIPEAPMAGAPRDIEVRVHREGVRLDYQRRYYDRESFEAALSRGRGAPTPPTQAGPALAAYRRAVQALEAEPMDVEKAVEALERATKADSRFGMAWTLLGGLYAVGSRPDDARAAFDRAIEADPAAMQPYWGLVQLAASAQDWPLVKTEAARLLACRPNEPAGLFAAALAEWNLENVEAAEKAARMAVDEGAAEEFPKTYRLLGLALAAKGDLAGAAAAYESYLGGAPEATDADEIRTKLAEWRSADRLETLRGLAEQGKWPEIAELSQQLLNDGERTTEAHFFQALAQFNLGRSALAEEHAKLAAEGQNAANLPEIRYLLGLLAAQKGDTRTAAAEYRAYLAAKPDSNMAGEIQARIDEWEAVHRSAPAKGPISALEELKARVKRSLDAVPNYACSIVMERGEMAPRNGRDHARALARAESEGKPKPVAVFDRSDRVRLDVAMIGGRELFAWPGESGFSERPLAEMIGFGAASTGDYALHARNVFVEQSTAFRAAGLETVAGREAERYNFFVPAEQSRFAVQQAGAPVVVPYEGSIWAAGAELTAVELFVKAFPKDYDIEWSRTYIEYQNVVLGRETFLLPRVSDISIRFRSGAQNSLRVAFRDCRGYQAESAITFGETATAADEPEPAPHELRLPPDLGLSVRLDSPIRPEDAMVGDPVQGVLDRPLLVGLETAYSSGARVQGRIRRLDLLTQPGPHWVIGIELTHVDADGRYSKIAAEMVGVAGLSGRIDVASTVEGMRAWRNMGDGEAWKAFFRRWDDGTRSSGPSVYYERFLPHVGLLFVHGREFELAPGLTTRWVTIQEP